MNLPAQEHQASMVKGKPMFHDNQFKRQMDKSDHTATVHGHKTKAKVQKRYLGNTVNKALNMLNSGMDNGR